MGGATAPGLIDSTKDKGCAPVDVCFTDDAFVVCKACRRDDIELRSIQISRRTAALRPYRGIVLWGSPAR